MMAYIGFGYPRFYFDWTYLLVIIGVVLSLWASAGVRSAFNRFSTVATIRGMTGAQAAQHILAQSGIYDVRSMCGEISTIIMIPGIKHWLCLTRYTVPLLWRRSAWRPTNAVMPFSTQEAICP